jgi:AcrR family transcriptional regulator
MPRPTATSRIGSRPRATNDPRPERTRAALVASFNRLLLAHGYEAVTPASIAAAAGVARSTFYAHYSGKLSLLRDALHCVLQPLADAVKQAQSASNLELVLEHFWENRRLARALMMGKPRQVLQEQLAEMIESNLRRGGFALPVPLPMAAACTAHGQVAMLEYWLAGRGACSAAKLAAALRGIAVASVSVLVVLPAAERP